jgi:hypothetical protein
VSTGGQLVADPRPVRRRLDASDVAHLTFIDEVFVPQAVAEGVIDDDAARGLSDLVQRLTDEAWHLPLTVEAVQQAGAFAAAPAGASETLTTGVPAGTAEPAVVRPEPRVREPGPLRQWWQRSRTSIGADLAVHGLAYLGVLLLFVGAFGLVAFAFGGVEPTWRPVAEVAIAAAPFLTSALLLRRGAEIVGRSLELAGGLLLPVMVMTVFLDDVPPDLDGVSMVVVMTLVLLALAVGYAAWSRRHVESALRFVAAPLVWLAAGVAVMGAGRELPAGAAVASLTAVQVTAIAVSLAGTLAWARMLARRRPDDPLAWATLTSALAGAVVVAVMAVLTWVAEGFPLVPVLVTGVAGLLVLELLEARMGAGAVAVAQPVWWAVTSLALLAAAEPGVAGLVSAVGFGVLLERTASRRADVLPLALSAGGAALAFAVTYEQPWYGVVVAVVASVWAGWRRLRPFDVAGVVPALDVVAGVVPLVGLAWLAAASDSRAVPVVVGSCLALLAAVAAARGLLRRDQSDAFWRAAWLASAVLVTAMLALAGDSAAQPDRLGWLLPVSAGVLAVAASIGPMPALLRPWAVLGLATAGWALLGAEIGLPISAQALVVAVAALCVVVVAHVPSSGLEADTAGSLGLAGHVLALAAMAPAVDSAAALATVTAAATAGLLVTTVADASGRSAVGAVLARAHPLTHYLAPMLTAVGVPLTAALTMDALAVPIWSEPGPLTLLLAVTALVYALLTRLAIPRYPQDTLILASSAAAVLGVLSLGDRTTATAGLAVLVATVLVLPTARRPKPMVWLAWAAVAPLVGLLAVTVFSSLADLPAADVAASALVGVGALLLVCGLAVDAKGPSDEPQWRLSDTGLRPVVVTGAAQVFVGLTMALQIVSAPAAGWLTLVVAGVVLAAAALRRVGLVASVGLVLAWVAVLMLTEGALLDRGWVAVLVGAGLLVLADIARSWAREPWWARWDVSIFVAAHVVVATAGLAVLGPDERPLVLATIGLVGLAVAWRLRHVRPVALAYMLFGGAFVLAAAIDAGPGWTSLALLAITGALVGAAVRTDEPSWAAWLQVGAAVAVVGSWQQASVWWQLTGQQTVDVTAVGAGVLVLVAAGALWPRPSLRLWALAWGGVGSLVVLGVGLFSMADSSVQVSALVVAGTGVVSLAWVLAAEALDADALRYGGLGVLLVALVQALSLAGASVGAQVAVLTATAVVATLVALGSRVLPHLTAWQRPALALAAVATVGSGAVALGRLPELALLVPVLLVAAGVAAAAGVVLSSVWLRVLAPVLACLAWLVYAAGALRDSPQWYTVPMGLALLVVVVLLRQEARARGGNPAGRAIVTLELVGIAFLVGASFVQSVTDSLAYVALALVFGAGVGAWGLLTKVRRRLLAGAGIVLAAVVVLLAVPLVSLLPSWQGTALWIFLAGAGLVALLAATAIEKGRVLVGHALARYTALGETWE